MNSIDVIPTAQSVSTHVISLEDYRKQHKPNQSPRKAKNLAAEPPTLDPKKEEILELLKRAKPNHGVGELELRLQSIEKHLNNIQAAICKNGGGHE